MSFATWEKQIEVIKEKIPEHLRNLPAPAQIKNMYFHIYFSTDQYADCGDIL
jgi:hypothetical protein